MFSPVLTGSPSTSTYVGRTYNLAVNPVVLPDSIYSDWFVATGVLYVTLAIVLVSLLQNGCCVAHGKSIARGRLVWLYIS
jgi:hypothetical protein